MGKKFIDRKSAKTYQLVYRSQEDPLAFEEGSSERVFVELQKNRGAKKSKGKETDQTVQKSLRDLQLDDIDDEGDIDKDVGQAALYGIYLDDREYDYTKHLRQVGTGGGVLLEAPTKKEKQSGIQILDVDDDDIKNSKGSLPAEVMPSKHRMDIKSEAVPTGLQPYMNPNLRDVLEALDEEEVDEFDDDFLDKLNADELSSEDENAMDSSGTYDDGEDDDESFDPNDVFAAVQRMKARQQQYDSDEEYDEDDSQDGVGTGRMPRTARTASTGFSMSSSAMFRNEKLTLLDEQFDKIEAMYEDDGTDSENERYDSDGHHIVEYDSDGNPKPISSRPDFESVMNEFLADYELTGKRMQVVVEGGTGAGKLSTFRNAMFDASKTTEENKKKLLQVGLQQIEESNAKTKEMEEAEFDELFKEKKRTPWDCQTILTTYSNLDNHPATIYEERNPQIRVSRRTGFPVVVNADDGSQKQEKENDDVEMKDNKGKARSKGETQEEKRARKKQLQEEKRNRRQQKKDNQDTFAEKQERRKQSKKDRAQLVIHMD
ncbi:Low temperature viability protein-domain-containing protein [Coemansia spiralis]|nr:Low temperature viability protein-domain-containing protein [Coemansia spiralis]